MGPSGHRRRVLLWRLALLGSVAAVLLVVGVLYWTGRQDKRSATPDARGGVDPQGARIVTSGFDYTANDGDRPLFRIRAGVVRADALDKVTLEDVAITLYRANGEVYDLEGESAIYDRASTAARIEGAARLSGPGGLRLETTALEMEPGGRRIRSDAPVRISMGSNYRGSAERFDADLRSETFLLAGAVRLVGDRDGAVPIQLTSRRLLVDRSSGTLHAESEVRLTRASDVLEARRISLQLDAAQENIVFVRARWEVVGRFRPAGDSAQIDRLRVRGTALSLFLSEGEPDRFELEGPRRRAARLVALQRGGGEIAIEALYVHGRFGPAGLVSAEALEEVLVEETPSGAARATQSATSNRAEADFRSGTVIAVSLLGEVQLRRADLEGSGDAAYLDLEQGQAQLQGSPARARGDRGSIEAPRITRQEKQGLLQAGDGVLATLPARSVAALGGGGLDPAGSEPIRVAAREASFLEAQRSFVFSGEVRAWRGEELILADQLRGEEATGRLAAQGEVRTLWRPATDETSLDDQVPKPGVVEISADRLLYLRESGRAEYSGQVVARQDGRLVSCDDAVLHLDEANRLQRFVCTGKARIEEPALGRSVTGREADYGVAAGVIVVRGEEVVLVDPQRGRATGRELIYELATRRIRLSALESAAPTADLGVQP